MNSILLMSEKILSDTTPHSHSKKTKIGEGQIDDVLLFALESSIEIEADFSEHCWIKQSEGFNVRAEDYEAAMEYMNETYHETIASKFDVCTYDQDIDLAETAKEFLSYVETTEVSRSKQV